MVKREILRFILFSMTIGVLVLLIQAINWLPFVVQQDTLRPYATVEDAQSALKLEHVYVPSYFPQSIAWPPAQILAQSRPAAAVLMRFRDASNSSDALLIVQTASGDTVPILPLALTKVAESTRYPLRGRDALLEVGTCDKTDPCSRISWSENGTHIVVVMRSSPFELIRIANSMLH